MKTRLLIFMLLWSPTLVRGQDIFDLKHSLRYADYLYETGDFETSIKEYERVLFVKDSAFIKYRLFLAYRQSGQYQKALGRLDNMFKNKPLPNFAVAENLKLLLLSQQFEKAIALTHSTDSLSSKERINWQTKTHFLAKNWKSSDSLLVKYDSTTIENRTNLAVFLSEQRAIQHKSPALAGALSVVLPSAGKFYTKDWKDGLVGLIFIGSLYFQSYRGFAKNGSSSVMGWLYGGIGLGFHLGNIYGSAKSAKQFNRNANENVYRKIKTAVFGSF